MTKSIYRKMCEPSPLSKPPPREQKLLTREEFDAMLKEAQDAVERGVGTGIMRTELVKPFNGYAYSRKVK